MGRQLALGLAMAAASTSCAQATQLVVVVDVFDPADGMRSFDTIEIEASRPGTAPVTEGRRSLASPTLPASFGVVPVTGDPAQPVDVRVVAYAAGLGRRREISTSFRPGRRAFVYVDVSESCDGVVCGQDETCRAGSCLAIDPAPGCAPTSESCNALDDDCDGNVDEGFSCGVCATSCPPGARCAAGGTCRCPFLVAPSTCEQDGPHTLATMCAVLDPIATLFSFERRTPCGGSSVCECIENCAPGWGDCRDDPGCETLVFGDPAHCGVCDRACAIGASCVDGRCTCGAAADECLGGTVECVDAVCRPAPIDLVGGERCPGTVLPVSDTYRITTIGRTDDFTLPCAPAGSSPDLVFQIDPARDGIVTVRIEGASIDTVLAVGTTCGGSELGCADDNGDGVSFDEELTFAADSSGTYWIVVDGVAGAAGDVTLSVTGFAATD